MALAILSPPGMGINGETVPSKSSIFLKDKSTKETLDDIHTIATCLVEKTIIPDIISLFILTQNEKCDIQTLDEKTKIAIIDNKHATERLALVTECKFNEINSYIYELNNQISSLVQQNSVLISKLNDDSLISKETGKNFFENLSTNKKKGENPSSVSDTNNMIKKRKLNDN